MCAYLTETFKFVEYYSMSKHWNQEFLLNLSFKSTEMWEVFAGDFWTFVLCVNFKYSAEMGVTCHFKFAFHTSFITVKK